eukprot:scaffold257831_cov31-Tisochrysis_lutea.AAC.2
MGNEESASTNIQSLSSSTSMKLARSSPMGATSPRWTPPNATTSQNPTPAEGRDVSQPKNVAPK